MVTTSLTTDVVILGAGISGLSVARQLCRVGLRTIVLEARERVGGRLLSVGDAGSIGDAGRVDLGATWFWGNEERVARLCSDLNVPTFPQAGNGDDLHEMMGTVRRWPSDRAGIAEFRVDGGTATLAERLAAALPDGVLRLQARAKSVTRLENGQHLRVDFEEDDRNVGIATTHVVVALPPALAVSSLTFQPALDEELTAVMTRTPVWMGATGKFLVVFDRPFWREAGLSGRAFSRSGPLFEIHDASGRDDVPAALFGFCMPRGLQDPGPSENEVLAQLTRLFGEQAKEPKAVHKKLWWLEDLTVPEEALALNDYSHYGHPLLQRSAWNGFLHWSTTETASFAPGHIEGALEAAERVASFIEDGRDS